MDAMAAFIPSVIVKAVWRDDFSDDIVSAAIAVVVYSVDVGFCSVNLLYFQYFGCAASALSPSCIASFRIIQDFELDDIRVNFFPSYKTPTLWYNARPRQ